MDLRGYKPYGVDPRRGASQTGLISPLKPAIKSWLRGGGKSLRVIYFPNIHVRKIYHPNIIKPRIITPFSFQITKLLLFILFWRLFSCKNGPNIQNFHQFRGKYTQISPNIQENTPNYTKNRHIYTKITHFQAYKT